MNERNERLSTSSEVLEHIKRWEGFRSEAYRCPAGVLTIGFGHTSDSRFRVSSNATITRDEAEKLLMHDIKEAEEIVLRDVKVALNNNQFSALVSFVFNRGSLHYISNGKRYASTLLKKLNSEDYEGAAKEFERWVNAKDPVTGELKKLKGLVLRRKMEAEIFRRDAV